MIPRTELPEALMQLALMQAGALSREQVLAFGITDRVIDRLVAQGTWRRVTRGILAASEESWLQLAWAGLLLGGPKAILGEQSAGYLHGIERHPPEQVVVFIGRDGRVARDDRWRFVRSDRLGIREPARTRLPETVVDIARSLTEDEMTSMLAEVIGSGRVRPEDILRVAHATARLPHRKLFNDVLSDVAEGVDSPLELRYLRTVERAHALPRAERRRRPAQRFRTDAWYREYGVIVELDGDAYHRGVARSTDMTRDNLHQLNGMTTLRFTWTHIVGNPCGAAEQVAAMLTARGWSGGLQSCPRC
ncbi:MAG TPA: type IV toxin-antitoxin system AbiEi family antitoxin domain-containing protein [Propionicimonas sp.]|nr:type IV toxin-antitoxin system AbiEi family antitoxin domain-containing protein [Propionicimonas sp.]HRA05294.1 type IV toxin-antitoxin system AbiEi family antitoxin domain-containing protein [Propionicimonas sp.]